MGAVPNTGLSAHLVEVSRIMAKVTVNIPAAGRR